MKTAAGVTYLYDGDGRRVYKAFCRRTLCSVTLYWYGAGDEILAETAGSTTTEYIYFGGKRIAMLPAGGSAQFYAEDFLGTSRVVTQNNGAVCYDGDFTPFGGELPWTNSCPTQNKYKFEGKERDIETGNDEFGARYYSWRFGRWLSADWSAVPVPVPYANLTNPQTLNLYSMVADDPESFADLDGHTQMDLNDPSCEGPCETARTRTGPDSDTPAVEGQAGAAGRLTAGNQQDEEDKKKKKDKDKGDDDKQNSPTQESGGKGGGQPRGGERGKSSKPESWKHTRPSKDHPGQYEQQDHQTGKWVLKPKGWSPNTQRVILGVEVGITAYAIYRVVRMLPSLAPPLWETILLNAALP